MVVRVNVGTAPVVLDRFAWGKSFSSSDVLTVGCPAVPVT